MVVIPNSQSKLSKIVPTRKDKAAPGALAQELGAANEKARQKIAAAEAEREQARQSVIQRGAQRMQDIADLQAELAKEQTELDAVVSGARNQR